MKSCKHDYKLQTFLLRFLFNDREDCMKACEYDYKVQVNDNMPRILEVYWFLGQPEKGGKMSDNLRTFSDLGPTWQGQHLNFPNS